MKQTIKFTCIGLALVLMLAGCGVDVANVATKVISEGSGAGELVSQEKQTFNKEQFDAVEIKTDIMEIIVMQGDSDEGTVELLRDSNLKDELTLHTSVANS